MQQGDKKPPIKRSRPRDPRIQFLSSLPSGGTTLNHIAFKRETKPETKTITHGGVLSRKRPKSEWKEEPKVEISSVDQVLEELKNAAINNDLTNFQLYLGRFNSVYIHRLRQTKSLEVAKFILEMIVEIKDSDLRLPFGDELVHLLKSIFIRYDISKDVAETVLKKILDSCDDIFYVSGSLFTLAEALLESDKISTRFCDRILDFAKQNIVKYDENCRVLAAQFIIAYLNKTDNEEEKKELSNCMLECCNDRNPKIRRFAAEGIERFFKAEKSAPFQAYTIFAKLCQDYDKFVRLASLRIIRLFADFYPNKMVSEGRKFPILLVDDAFTTICHSMNDLDVYVRALAAELLGTFDNVSDSFLFQTLDKKLMKNMKRLADGKAVTGASNEWSTGKKLGEDVPVDAKEEEGQSLIPTGACGAFVTALEDEFKAVRQPAVYSLGRLAATRPAFANACIDHLADMFNDEIAAVRIDAIRALTPLVTYGVLQLEQLKTLLTGLDDASQDSRIALMELLSRSNFTQSECIKDLISRLVGSLHRFPRDQQYIFKCVASIGARHSNLLADFVAEVYHLHPFLTRVEESINDQFYLIKLIIILNAAAKSDSICSLLPAYVKKNYRFVRLTMPNLVPPIPAFDNKSSADIEPSLSTPFTTAYNINQIMGKEFTRLVKIQQTDDFLVRQSLYERFLQDLTFFLKVESEYSHVSNYLHSLAKVLMLMDKIMICLKNENIPKYSDIQEVFQRIYFLEFGCNNVPKKVQYFLLECSVNLNVVYSVIRLINDPKNFIQDATNIFNDELRRVQKRLVEIDHEPTNQLGSLLRFLLDTGSYKNMPLNAQDVLKAVYNNDFTIDDQTIAAEFENVRIKSVKIVEPSDKKRYTMMMGLPTGVLVSCVLSNVTSEDVKNFRIRLKYADDTSSYFLPPRSDFTQINETQWTLNTHALIAVREGLASGTTVQLTFGVFNFRNQCSSVIFYDRCFGFLPTALTAANAHGQFLAFPNTDDLLSIATANVQADPIQVKKVS